MSIKIFIRSIALPLIYLALFSQNLFAQNASIKFDGIDDYIQTNVPPIAGGAARTVEAWIKLTSNTDPNAGGLQNVIVDMGAMTTGSRFTFNVLFGNAIRLEVQGNGVNGTIPVNDGLWHHVAGVYNPLATNKVSLYVDGVLDIAGNFTVTANTSATGDVVIGRRVDGINRFNGNIDEVRIWNVAKTLPEIIASKNAELCNSTANLYAYFPMNDGVPSGNNTNAMIYDQSNSFKTGTFLNFDLTGTNSNFSPGKVLNPGMTVTKFNRTVCSSYTWPASGITYTTPGTYLTRKTKTNGCDSILKLNLSVATSILTSDTVSACDTFLWSLNGNSYGNSGVYVDTTIASGGCDSIVTLMLTVGTIAPTTQHITACDSYTWSVNGTQYLNSIYTSHTYTNAKGCDSVVFLDLTINKSSNNVQSINACDSYSWSANNQTYTNSGQYFALIKNAKGCDSSLTLNLTINPISKVIDNVNACVEYTWQLNWKKYTENTRDSVVYQSTKGCDSIVVLNLKVKKVDVGVTATTNSLFAQYTGAAYQWINCSNLNNVVGATSQNFFPVLSGEYAVIVSYNGCSDTSKCFNFVSHVGIENQSKTTFKIFPNPSNDQLFVEGVSNEEPVEVKIYSIHGELLKIELLNKNNSIDIKLLDQGIYFIKIDNSIQRFIKL